MVFTGEIKAKTRIFSEVGMIPTFFVEKAYVH